MGQSLTIIGHYLTAVGNRTRGAGAIAIAEVIVLVVFGTVRIHISICSPIHLLDVTITHTEFERASGKHFCETSLLGFQFHVFSFNLVVFNLYQIDC